MIKFKSCERCCCVDSQDNPVLVIMGVDNVPLEFVCLMCYTGENQEDEVTDEQWLS